MFTTSCEMSGDGPGTVNLGCGGGGWPNPCEGCQRNSSGGGVHMSNLSNFSNRLGWT